MAQHVVSPSGTITAGQIAKFVDLQTAALRKSSLPSAETQYVLENQGAEIADTFVADVRRRVEARQRATELHILQRRSFDPQNFLGSSWKIDELVGKRSGNNLDAGKLVGKDYFKKGESSINGEERLRRIKANADDVQLDADDFLALWEEKGHITLHWLYETKGITWLSFWATILRRSDGDRRVLYLYRDGYGSWRWHDRSVGSDSWDAGSPAAVLVS